MFGILLKQEVQNLGAQSTTHSQVLVESSVVGNGLVVFPCAYFLSPLWVFFFFFKAVGMQGVGIYMEIQSEIVYILRLKK